MYNDFILNEHFKELLENTDINDIYNKMISNPLFRKLDEMEPEKFAAMKAKEEEIMARDSEKYLASSVINDPASYIKSKLQEGEYMDVAGFKVSDGKDIDRFSNRNLFDVNHENVDDLERFKWLYIDGDFDRKSLILLKMTDRKENIRAGVFRKVVDKYIKANGVEVAYENLFNNENDFIYNVLSLITWGDSEPDEYELMISAHRDGMINVADIWNIGDVRTIRLSYASEMKLVIEAFTQDVTTPIIVRVVI
jgi:hypothetical protein